MSVTTFDPSAPPVSATEAALRHFQAKLSGDQVLRLSTRSSGCTGYAYVLDIVEGPEANDEIVQLAEGVQLAVDPQALTMVRGTEIDFVTEGVNRVLKFNNPNVVAECGCGESFSVN